MFSIKSLVITLFFSFTVSFSAMAESDKNFVEKVNLHGINSMQGERVNTKQEIAKSLAKEDINVHSSAIDPTVLLFVLFPLFIMLIRANSKHN